MSYAAKISELSQRLASTEIELSALINRRKEFALDAIEGKEDAIKALHELDNGAAALGKERDTLRAAIEQAECLKIDEASAVAQKERERREAEFRKTADEILETNAQIDTAMNQLREMFARRANLNQQLGRTGMIDSTVILRMAQKFGPNAAARAAGLHKFIGIEHIPPNLVTPLVESSKILRAQR